MEECRRILAGQTAYGPHESTARPAGEHIALGRNLYRSLPEDVHDRQPLVGGNGRYHLVADLRLDNRDDLIKRFGIAASDAGRLSDADILLHAYERLRDGVLDIIVGDYAFALWDGQIRRLLLARDPLGQRPLCYHRATHFFAFASMPKGLHALAQIDRTPDLVRLTEFVGTVPYLGPRTFYKGVSRVEPGHAVTFDGSELSARQFWKPERSELRLSGPDEYRDALREQLDRAVKAGLRGAGNTVATHLSSGWDSSAVTATAARLIGETSGRVSAYTSVPRRGNNSGAPNRRITDEGKIAARTAAFHNNIDHFVVEGAGQSPIANLDAIVKLYDRPLINLCNEVWLSAIRSDAVQGGAKVLLTGEVGNWTISASPVSLLADLLREGQWLSWWREARAKVRTGGARYRGVAASSFGPWLPKRVWKMFTPLSSATAASNYSAIHPSFRDSMERKREKVGAFMLRPPRNSFVDTAAGLAEYDYGNFRKAALAGWGLDERDPTADRRLIEFCLSLPLDMLLKDGVRRPLARAALADRLPPEVLDEKSKGYQAADWHEGLTRDLATVSALLETIASDDVASRLIDVDAIRGWIRDWPLDGWEKLAVMARYRTALLQALGAGHFIATMRK